MRTKRKCPRCTSPLPDTEHLLTSAGLVSVVTCDWCNTDVPIDREMAS